MMKISRVFVHYGMRQGFNTALLFMILNSAISVRKSSPIKVMNASDIESFSRAPSLCWQSTCAKQRVVW